MTHSSETASSSSEFTAIKHVYSDGGTQSAADAIGLAGVCDWLLANVQLSPDVKGQILAAKSKLVAQAKKGEHHD